MIRMSFHNTKECKVMDFGNFAEIEFKSEEGDIVSIIVKDLEEIEQFAQDILNQVNEIKGTK